MISQRTNHGSLWPGMIIRNDLTSDDLSKSMVTSVCCISKICWLALLGSEEMPGLQHISRNRLEFGHSELFRPGGKARRLSLFSVPSQSSSSSSSSFVLGRFSDGTSETPVACFLHSFFFHPANCLDPQPRTKDDDENEDD
jgi:hypothetical protein